MQLLVYSMWSESHGTSFFYPGTSLGGTPHVFVDVSVFSWVDEVFISLPLNNIKDPEAYLLEQPQ